MSSLYYRLEYMAIGTGITEQKVAALFVAFVVWYCALHHNNTAVFVAGVCVCERVRACVRACVRARVGMNDCLYCQKIKLRLVLLCT